MTACARPLSAVFLKMTSLVVASPDPEQDLKHVWRQYAMYWQSAASQGELLTFLATMDTELGLIMEEHSIVDEHVMTIIKAQQKVLRGITLEVENKTLPAGDNTVFCHMLKGTFAVMQLLLTALRLRRQQDAADDDVTEPCLATLLSLNQSMHLQSEERHVFEALQLAHMQMLQVQTTTALAQKARDAQAIKKLKAENKRLQARNAEMEDIMSIVSAAMKRKHDVAVGQMEEGDGPAGGAAGGAAGGEF